MRKSIREENCDFRTMSRGADYNQLFIGIHGAGETHLQKPSLQRRPLPGACAVAVLLPGGCGVGGRPVPPAPWLPPGCGGGAAPPTSRLTLTHGPSPRRPSIALFKPLYPMSMTRQHSQCMESSQHGVIPDTSGTRALPNARRIFDKVLWIDLQSLCRTFEGGDEVEE